MRLCPECQAIAPFEPDDYVCAFCRASIEERVGVPAVERLAHIARAHFAELEKSPMKSHERLREALALSQRFDKLYFDFARRRHTPWIS